MTDTGWFHEVAPRAQAICFTYDRLKFVHATREDLRPCQGQAVFYFGPQAARFREVFRTIGLLMQVLESKASPQMALGDAPAAAAPQDTPDTPGAVETLGMACWLAVKKLQPCTNADVAQFLGRPRNSTHRALAALVKQGTVSKEDQTYWALDAPGTRQEGGQDAQPG